MSRGSPEALARDDQPLPICNQKYVCIFFHPPSQKNSCSSPPKNNLSRGSPEALARHVNPLQYLNKYVSIFSPPPPPAHQKKNPAPPSPTKKKKKSTLKNKMSRGSPLAAGQMLSSDYNSDFIPYKTRPFVYRNRIGVTRMQYVKKNQLNYMSVLGLTIFVGPGTLYTCSKCSSLHRISRQVFLTYVKLLARSIQPQAAFGGETVSFRS